MKVSILILLTLITQLPDSAWAKTSMKLTPNTCVVKPGETCKTKIKVSVAHPVGGVKYCLSVPAVHYYQCATKRKPHSFDLEGHYSQAIQLILIDKDTEQEVDKRTFSVLTYQPIISRKRRSFSWGFNYVEN